ncbi:MAG: hypothetical protein MH252_21145 [Thermosynechococcaceae cyanobacterium MS004]|nr:hypothetical protein [Thermosynechococcaceae cyanobacterium MS004]
MPTVLLSILLPTVGVNAQTQPTIAPQAIAEVQEKEEPHPIPSLGPQEKKAPETTALETTTLETTTPETTEAVAADLLPNGQQAVTDPTQALSSLPLGLDGASFNVQSFNEPRADATDSATLGPLEPFGQSPAIIAQGADTPSEPAGLAPSLQTEPSTPDQKPFIPAIQLTRRSVRYSPSITLLTPSGYGKSWGQVSIGGSFQSRARFVTEPDGAFGVGFGLGDSRKWVGLDVGIFVADVTNFSRGGVGFKLHRQFPNQLAIAVGVNNALTWGNIDGGISPYGVVSKGFQLRENTRLPLSQLYISAGAGTGRYRSEDDVANQRNAVGAFGSVALRLVQPVNLIAEWSGQDLSLGFSILPFPRLPIVISPFVTDITGSAGDGPRFAFSVGMGFTF